MSHPKLRTLDDLPLDGKRVLVRADLNVSVNHDGTVGDGEDYRIEAVIPTLEELIQRRCRIIILTHHGRPDEGETGAAIDIAPIHRRLEQLLKEPIRRAHQLYGDEVEAIVSGLEPGQAVLLPNVRSDDREMTNNRKFAQALASTAEIYVNEAFSASHRAHASIALVPQILPGCAGRRLVQEVKELTKLVDHPEHPYVAITSGAKISTKVGMLHRLLKRVDILVLGGQLANVFLAAQGRYPGHRFAPDETAAARHIIDENEDKLILPRDVVIGDPTTGEGATVVSVDDIPADSSGIFDVGPATVEVILKQCQQAKTIMWNGPLGKFEIPAYAKATQALAEALAHVPAYRVVGGGDTVNALEQARLVNRYDHVSVGGGAMVAFLEGKKLPGLEPLYE